MAELVYVFIIMAILMGIFCMFVIARDLLISERERRQKKNDNQIVERIVVEEKPVVKETVCEPIAVEEVATTEVNDDSAVVFSTATQTLEEKYLELSQEHKGYYDEIVKYAMAVEGSKRFKNESYEEYKVGKNRLVRLKIKRGVIVCELVIPNLTFKTYVADNKVAMKHAPATIKVVDEVAFTAVKDSIDIAVKAIEEERAYRKEQAKIRRKQKRENAQ
ncbi:MAG: hypothetical protein IKC71_02100 [Clostridia bacterium]|nr:hypothetical protein [Clostridia bacterium]